MEKKLRRAPGDAGAWWDVPSLPPPYRDRACLAVEADGVGRSGLASEARLLTRCLPASLSRTGDFVPSRGREDHAWSGPGSSPDRPQGVFVVVVVVVVETDWSDWVWWSNEDRPTGKGAWKRRSVEEEEEEEGSNRVGDGNRSWRGPQPDHDAQLTMFAAG